jgi:hypothetical protein
VLARIVRDWPLATSEDRDASLSDQQISEIANQLADSEIISTRAPITRDSSPVIVEPRCDLVAVDQDAPGADAPSAKTVAAFLSACVSAAIDLKFSHFAAIVSKVRARKRSAARPLMSFDVAKAAEVASVFRRLRPYTFTGRNRCLFHGLALVNFMASNDLYPTWMLGVALNPWRAHSWVQQDNFIFDSTPEQVFDFRPILCV